MREDRHAPARAGRSGEEASGMPTIARAEKVVASEVEVVVMDLKVVVMDLKVVVPTLEVVSFGVHAVSQSRKADPFDV
jgi:hypothetical protein